MSNNCQVNVDEKNINGYFRGKYHAVNMQTGNSAIHDNNCHGKCAYCSHKTFA